MSDSETPGPRSEKEIFFEAMERCTPQERSAFLDGACGTNPVQRARVEALLADHYQQDGFMRDPAVEAPPLSSPEPAPPETPAQMLGRYKLLEKIGEGGFGEVWMAEQREPVRRRVALKIIKLGMDSRQVVARFEAERQALAMMDHENIARIFDADITETGRPYFVMELVRGIKITDYCDQNQIPTRERLDLFIKVCQAIQHAHQKGIIHRDIKPTNILVTLHDGVPVPKVIDFGIAKATQSQLTDKTLFTQFQQFIGTPAYISPEQAELSGLDIDTRADIYSLGVLLYELLVGQTPIDAKEMLQGGLDALRQIIREREPQRPSTKLHTLAGPVLTTAAKCRQTDEIKLVHQLEGDLDWIVMKCLEKDRSRRYDTANGLAMDIQRHLASEPISARPPTAAYKIQKAWQRNKTAFTAVAAVSLALIAGTGISIWQAVEATEARKEESQQRVAAEKAREEAAREQKKAETEKNRAETEKERAEGLVYASNLMLAQSDFESGNGALAQYYLDRSEVKRRGWEYRYLRARTRPLLTLSGNTSNVADAAWSPDGNRIVTASDQGIATVWEAGTGRKLRELKGPRLSVSSVAFSPDSKRVVIGSGEWRPGRTASGDVKVWEVDTGEAVHDLKGHTAMVRGAAFSPDGMRIAACGDDHTVKIWDAGTGAEVFTLTEHPREVSSLAFRPDGQRLISAGYDGTVNLWDSGTGQEVPFALKSRGPMTGVFRVTFSRDGRRIATAHVDRSVKVWDAATGEELWVVPVAGTAQLSDVAFNPDGTRIVVACYDYLARVYETTAGRPVFVLKGHSSMVHSAAFSPDGKRILTASNDGTAKVWDGITGQEVPVLKAQGGHINTVRSAAFSTDGKHILTASYDGTARVWDTVTGEQTNPPFRHVNSLYSAAFSPDGRHIVAASYASGGLCPVKVWDAATGADLHTLTGHTLSVHSVAFSPDGRRVVTGSNDKTAKIWDTETWKEVRELKGHAGPVICVAFSPDSRRIATTSNDTTGKVWDAETGALLVTLNGATYGWASIAFSADGRRLVTGAPNNTAVVWDAAAGTPLLTLTGHAGAVAGAAFSPDGTRIATASLDASVKIWEAATGQEVFSIKVSQVGACWVQFSPDGQRLLACIGGQQAIVKIWSAEGD